MNDTDLIHDKMKKCGKKNEKMKKRDLERKAVNTFTHTETNPPQHHHSSQ